MIHSGRYTRSSIVIVILLLIAGQGLAQRKYYEFRNPDALKINKKRMALLTSTDWEYRQMDVYMRGDKASYTTGKGQDLSYRPDGTYSCRQFTGTWKVRYNRYLVHTVVDEKGRSRNPIQGIYSITHLNDTSMTLTKIHSSNGDMMRTLTFHKRAPDSLHWDARKGAQAKTHDSFRKVFDGDEPVNFFVLPQRSDVAAGELDTIDSLALAFIKVHGGDHHGRSSTSLRPYFRQYVGYIDKGGHHIVYLNVLTTYHNNWKEELIVPSPAIKADGFRIYVDLSRGECFGFNAFGED